MVNRNETGKDAVLQVNGNDIPITNLDFDEDIETASDEWNDDFNTIHSYVSGETSGTFEWAGSVPAAREQVLNDDGVPRAGISIQINASEETFRINNVRLTNYSRSFPGDDTSGGTVEFVGYTPNYS